MIKAICFDLDGVYFQNGKSNFIKALTRNGVSETEATRVFLKSDEMNSQYKLGKLSDEEFWSWALDQWKLDMTTDQIVDILIEGYEVNEFAVEYVKQAKNSGYKTVICSNNFPARINGLQKRFGFLNNFDVAVFSFEVGVDKPNKAIFEELIKRAEVKPEEIVYSDDDESKMAGAAELGINTFVYKDFRSFILKLEELGVEAD